MLHAEARGIGGRATRRAADEVADGLARKHAWHSKGTAKVGRRLQLGTERPFDRPKRSKARPGGG